ncbi:MAG: hypothetical protein ABJN22_13115 [Litorimonas sp.]
MSVVWIHEDAMTLNHPVFQKAGPAAQPVFIWDTEEHDRRGYSLKRRVFIYECAHDLNIPIYLGSPYDILRALAEGQAIYAAESADPYIKDTLSDLQVSHDVETVNAPQLAHIPANTDTARFFRFWNRAKKSALTHSSEPLIETI